MGLREEVQYRLSLAESNLKDSKKLLRDKLYHWSVLSAQLSVENSAKAIISCFKIPSWLHDPSIELEDTINEHMKDILNIFGGEMIEALKRLENAASELAPEHGRTTYGLIERRILPSKIYDETKASRAASLAEEAYKTAKTFIKKWFSAR